MEVILPKQSGVGKAGQITAGCRQYRIAQVTALAARRRNMRCFRIRIRDNLRLGLVNRLPCSTSAFAEIEPIFPVFGVRLRQYAGTLSGGEQEDAAGGGAPIDAPVDHPAR